jgi:hypothetical protein
MLRYSLLPAALAAVLGAPALAQETREEVLTQPFEDRRDQTLLKRVTERTFVHEVARVSFTVPNGWKEIRPHRLARRIDPRVSTVLGIERGDRDLVASIYWIPLNPGARLSEWVRDKPVGGEYGEEYETLRAVYGKDRVTTPVKLRHDAFDVYRVNISGGPDRGDRYDGALFVFEAESGGKNWLVKARVSFPKSDRGQGEEAAMEVLRGFTRLPAASGGDVKKTAADSDAVPDKK